MSVLTDGLACRNNRAMSRVQHIRSPKVAELLDDLGGQTVIADFLGVPVGTVGAWRHRCFISPGLWGRIVDLAKRRRVRGVSIEWLYEIHYGKEKDAA